eukprot:jgi/Botrbrau1/13386/Bobra.0194s0017.1
MQFSFGCTTREIWPVGRGFRDNLKSPKAGNGKPNSMELLLGNWDGFDIQNVLENWTLTCVP